MRKKIIIVALLAVLAACGYLVYHYFMNNKIPVKSSIILPEGTKADFVVLYKKDRKLVLLQKNIQLKEYHISLGDDPVGHKEKEGDKKTPEGLYKIDYRNPNSKYHYSLHISYPNKNDSLHAAALGVSPGGNIMIHGFPDNMTFLEDYYISHDWTDGCIAVSNQDIDEIAGAVPDGTAIYINP
jgi:murein L,D-transpeptidase YafK